MKLLDYLTFTEWYHYAILFLWMILLLTGVKYFYLFESNFKLKNSNHKGENYGKSLLISSFVTGLLLVIIFIFKPAQLSEQSELNWDYLKYAIFGLFIILIVFNALITLKNYELKSGIIRLVLMSIMMILYFYTGMLGGLLVIATFVLLFLIYMILKFKKILTIK
ncbi:MAG: hypothetical protein QM503_12695 [Bacteroidota bacterium]